MISMLAYSSQRQEIDVLYRSTKEQAAKLTNDRWEYLLFQDIDKIAEALQEEFSCDFICFDVTEKKSIFILEELRRKFRKAYIILIANLDTIPTTYMKPTIMAASLLLRPLQEELFKETVEVMLEGFEYEAVNNEEVLILEDKDGRERIAYENIYYFEAREKKIYACTNVKEYGFYNTLEQLEESLPEAFLRVHRGFIVNVKKIKKTSLTEGILYLKDGYIVPLSRSYRKIVKEWKQEGKIGC